MKVGVWIDNMKKAGCYFDPADKRKLIIPDELAERIGEKPGYFYLREPVNDTVVVERFNADGTSSERVM